MKRFFGNSLQILLFSLLLFSAVAHGSPQGGQVVGGSGSIQNGGNTTTIHQTSSSLAIDWNSFNVQAQETVNFLQPDANAIALNRILDLNPSRIDGRINANGQIILVNPNGLFFGDGATVNVGGLIASGLNITA